MPITVTTSLKVEDQFKSYLELVGLDPLKMHQIQYIETKRAFYGAWGQLLVLMEGEIPKLSEEEAVRALEKMKQDVMNYWLSTGRNSQS